MKKRLILPVIALALVLLLAANVYAASTVKVGDSGDRVRTIQTKLKNWGYYDGAVDGVFGSGTQKAVKAFQRRNGLAVDGVVGAATARALGIELTSSSGSTGNSRDVYLLAKAIHAEARGEPYTGKVAVGAVILNRVDSAQFPNTIAGVIYQRGAFTAVDDGQINLEPDEEAMRAARDAMNGWDPSGGCLYYYNPEKSTSQWIFSRKVVTTIGKHRFAI